MFHHLEEILFFPPGSREESRRAHQIWLGIGVTGLGLCVGILTLMLGAAACSKLPAAALFGSYFKNPVLLGLSLLPPVLLCWLFYLMTGRAWAGYLGSFLPCVGLALVNYYKIQLRGDPLLGVDLKLVTEAGGIMGRYTLEITGPVKLTILCFLLGLLAAILLLPRGLRGRKVRLWGSLVCVVLAGVSYVLLYRSPAVYNRTANTEYINPWSDVEVYASKGVLYPFLYSLQDLVPKPPQGYNKGEAQALLEEYRDSDIPQDRWVDVVGVMLEAFCDLTDFPELAQYPQVQSIYAPLHQLEQQSIHGDLLTNIFAGGTVDSEWGFLTGYTQHDEFRSPTDSYVWYLRRQGYDTIFHHPGHSWFYNRRNVNEYLGFQNSLFTEDYFGELVDPVTAVIRSDGILVDKLLSELNEYGPEQDLFSFSVSYQNHGPYGGGGQVFLTPAETGLSVESCDILNTYLSGISDTISHMVRLAQELEKRDKPTVLVFFGDHKPWLGNGDSVYHEIGADFDLSTLSGMHGYYSTPYVIWANSAAKDLLDQDFTGPGGDFSPCFLMPRLFDLLGWEGPGFMQLSREMREISPLVHVRSLFLQDGQLTDALPAQQTQFLRSFLGAQYYRETEIVPSAE